MKRVLILESNESFAAELAAHFSEKGYEVCGVTGDGAEGMKLLESASPSVVVLSLLLKNCDGFTVMEAAKNGGKKVDFIVLGNFSDDMIISRAIALGARYYLMKPVSAELVEERAAEVLEEGAPRSEKYERRRAGSRGENFKHLHLHRHSAAHQGL